MLINYDIIIKKFTKTSIRDMAEIPELRQMIASINTCSKQATKNKIVMKNDVC